MSVSGLGTSAPPPPPPAAAEQRLLLHAVPWQAYVTLRETFDEAGAHVRLTYLQGELELMSPSSEHEENKGLIGHLLEAWCVDRGIELFVQASTTLRDEYVSRGLEADESYSVGTYKRIPDLAIEVVHSAWKIDKLEVYRGLGVPEVWIFRDGGIEVFVRADAGYEARPRSALFPALDLALLARHVVPGTSLTAAVRAFRAAAQTSS